jgi:prepilin peptidase dependent protein B
MLSAVSKSTKRRRQAGLSIVEFMVGLAIGLFVVGGAIKLFVDMFVNNHRLLIEARLNQDLRAAADVIARDMRRGGYWRNSLTGVGAVAPAVPASNPHNSATIAANEVQYSYDRDGDAAVSSSEAAGFGLNGGAIRMLMSDGNWQPLTDPRSVLITTFSIANAADAEQWGALWQYCDCLSRLTCTAASFASGGANFATRPEVGMRVVDIVIEGQAVADVRMTRRLVETVRLRNDRMRGACPA